MKTNNDTASFASIAARLKNIGKRRRVALVCPDDSHTAYVVERVLNEGIADFTLFCGRPLADWVESLLETNGGDHIAVERMASPDEAARAAVAAVRRGEADLLMKGTINTDNLLRAVLDKQCGLLEPGAVLTHVALAEVEGIARLLAFSDAAVIPNPTIGQFDSIVRHLATMARLAGAGTPHIALLHCTEKVSEKFPVTLCYEELKQRAKHGDYGNVVVDGPMDVKTALDRDSGDIKGISSPVAGCADALVFPDIEAGNTFYKTISLFKAKMAGVLCGTKAPVVVASRADSGESKYNSLAVACALAQNSLAQG